MDSWATENYSVKNINILKPYEKNSRVHSEEQITEIEKSIKEWGWTSLILIDENNTIIAGHARYIAALNLDIQEVPTVMAKDWTEQQKKAFVIADNRISEKSTWDMGLLQNELKELSNLGFDIDLTGFDDSMLTNFEPMLTPSMDIQSVTGDDIINAEQRQSNLGQAFGNQETTVVCPHCLKEFGVQGY